MKENRRLKITTTKRRLARYRQPALRAFCQVCAREVETLSGAQAAEVLEVTAPRLEQFIAEGLVHAIATVSGSLRICHNSLYQ